MGKKSRIKKIKKKKFKSHKKIKKHKSNQNQPNIENNSNLNILDKKRKKELLHKRKEYKRKLKRIGKKNKNLFKVDHEIMDEIDEILWNQEEIERLPHDKFMPYLIPNTPEENKKYLPLLISDSDIILELLDARDIIHSRNKQFEELINNKKDKLLIYVLTKSDLVSSEYLSKIKNKLENENNNSIIISISSLIRETIQSLIVELKKCVENSKILINNNKTIKIGILGPPNVGKNSLIQSLELIVNANCNEKYIFFGEDKSFCINSVPAILFDEKEENNILVSKIYKNIKDINEPKKILQNLMTLVDSKILKDIYELEKSPDNLEELLFLIQQKYEFKEDNMSIWKILEDILIGKIKYEIDIDLK